jgi:putative ABC transport system permease protein
MTILIIAMSFVLMVFMPSIISGVIKVSYQQVKDYQYADLVLEPDGDNKYIDDTHVLLRKIEKIPGISAVSSHTIVSTSLISDKKTVSTGVIAIIPSDERKVTHTSQMISEGRYLTDGDTDTILIGDALAGQVQESKDKILSLGGVHAGDSIMVTFQNGVVRKMKVGGIYKTGFLNADGSAFITRKEMNSVLGDNFRSSSIIAKTIDGTDSTSMKDRLLEFGVRQKVWTFTEKANAIIGDAITSFTLITNIITVFSLIIAGIVIFIIVYINTIHQRRQIGILKAIGIPELDIIRSYVLQVGFIFICGTLTGLTLFWVLCEYFRQYPLQFPPGLVYPVPDMMQLIYSISILGIISMISGFIPAQKAVKEEILQLVNG